jgi:hypothetical protein
MTMLGKALVGVVATSREGYEGADVLLRAATRLGRGWIAAPMDASLEVTAAKQ